MLIERPKYLNQLINKKENGLIKIITGVRRCGKSYLLFKLYREYLNSIQVDDRHIIKLALDKVENAKYRNPFALSNYIETQIVEKNVMYYVFLDEIQAVATIQNPYLDSKDETVGFVDVLLDLVSRENVDLYVTGSNSKMLSTDVLTEFRGRGDEIRMAPLTFSEFFATRGGYWRDAWDEYYRYGGMPFVLSLETHEEKSKYLKDLFSKIYLSDVLERHKILNGKEVLEELLNIISSTIGSLTNPTKLSNTFQSIKGTRITAETVSTYLDYFIDAFLISKTYRYDIKGKRYIDTPLKYYFCDVGLRNARLNFRQQEENHLMENVIYNELCARDFDVDVGVVEYNYRDKAGKSKRTQLEIDFVVNKDSRRYYIQSALIIPDEEKRAQETNSLNRIPDSFKKIVVTKDNAIPWHDEKGVLYLGLAQFLLDDTAMDL